jgi:hypothetical protein
LVAGIDSVPGDRLIHSLYCDGPALYNVIS